MLRLADEYTEADHDRALQRLADDIEQAMPDPAWRPSDPPGTVDIDAPLVRDNDGEPVDLGQPWTRRDKIEFALFVVLMTGAVALVWWGAGR